MRNGNIVDRLVIKLGVRLVFGVVVTQQLLDLRSRFPATGSGALTSAACALIAITAVLRKRMILEMRCASFCVLSPGSFLCLAG